MDGYRVYFDREPGKDRFLLLITRTRAGRVEMMQHDGTWAEYDGAQILDIPTLRIDGQSWREIKPLLIQEIGALPPTAPETEVRVLREWLAVEQARVERAFGR